MSYILFNKPYFIFFGVYLLILFINYKSLKNPTPYPPKEIIEEFKAGRERLSSYKYKGLSHYAIPRLAKSESNWIYGNIYWFKASIKLAILGIIITLFITVLGEVFNLYEFFTALFMLSAPLVLGMIFICYRIEKNILKD
nr:hypothetical protein [Tissierella sp.]